MMLPSTLSHKPEWVFLGPMGPELPQNFLPLPILAVDGGAGFSETVDVWVGDADSYKHPVKARHIFRHNPQKDQSDLALAMSLMPDSHRYKLHFWGFLGGRKDHELFNLGEILRFLENHPESEVILYDRNGRVSFHTLGNGHWKFTHLGTFSLGTLKKTMVKMTGACQYPIPKMVPLEPLSSFGLSNVGSGEILLEVNGPVFIYFPEEP